MLRGEIRISKVYASCLDVLRKLATCTFWVRQFKNKNTLRRCIQGSKTTNKLQRRYLEVKQQEATCDSQIPSLKWNKQCTRDFFREWNNWSKGWLIYLEGLELTFLWANLKKKMYGVPFVRLNANKKCMPDVFTGI